MAAEPSTGACNAGSASALQRDWDKVAASPPKEIPDSASHFREGGGLMISSDRRAIAKFLGLWVNVERLCATLTGMNRPLKKLISGVSRPSLSPPPYAPGRPKLVGGWSNRGRSKRSRQYGVCRRSLIGAPSQGPRTEPPRPRVHHEPYRQIIRRKRVGSDRPRGVLGVQ